MHDIVNIDFNIEYLSKHLPRHSHRAYEIIFLLEGDLSYFVDERTYKLVPGSIVFINSHSMHQNVSFDDSKYKAIMVRFSKDFVINHIAEADNSHFFYSFYHKTRALQLTEQQGEELKTHLLEMSDEFEAGRPESRYYCATCLIQLLIKAKRIILQDAAGSQVGYPSYMHMKISRVAGYINSNYMKNISLSDLSENFGISECYLSRNFRKVTGFYFSEYLNTTRINMAKKLLDETNLTITRISEETGYNTITHFGRMFKNLTGVSPKKYRTGG